MSTAIEPAIIVKDVKKSFRIPLDKTSGIKQLIVNVFKRKKGYREFKALNGVSFEIKKGEFFGIVGRNGSGKSTLLKILAGVYTADSGGVAVNGSLTPFIELGVGFNPELSGRENVFLNGALLGFSREEMEAMYDDIVDFAELHDFMEERLKNYSSGMQVRLAFSIAIRADTDILILDEVLAVGDANFQSKCNKYFEKIKSADKTVILVTHSMEDVNRYCDRALMLDAGRVKTIGSTQKVSQMYIEDNFEQDTQSGKDLGTKLKDLGVKINNPSSSLKSTEDLKFDISCIVNRDTEIYFGLSLMYHGVSIADHNSLPLTIKAKAGNENKVTYTLPLDTYGSEGFAINVSVFDRGGTLLGYQTEALEFLVSNELSGKFKAGPVYIKGEWS